MFTLIAETMINIHQITINISIEYIKINLKSNIFH